MLAVEIGRMGDVQVIGKSDILSFMNLEKQRRLAGCDTRECISEIGGALGMRWVVSGNITLFGRTFVMNLKLLDTERMVVISRVSRKFRGEEDILIAELPEAAHDLFAKVGERIGLAMPGTVAVAARHYQPLEQSPSAITVITREDIEASGATTIPDLLRIVPGVEVAYPTSTTGILGGRLQWSSENYHFLVLIDGREANIELLGQTIFESEPIDLEDVQRIEVIRGPASALYGANALSGVISITTRAITEKTSGWAMVSAGEMGSNRLSLRASTRVGDWGISTNGGLDFLGQFEDPRAENKQVWKWRALAEHRWSETARLLLNTAMSGGSGARMTEMGSLALDYTLVTTRVSHESENLRGRIYWMYLVFDMALEASLDYGEIRLADLVPASVINQTIDGEVQWTLPTLWDPLMLMIGGGGRFSWIESDQLLDADTFADITSPKYNQVGLSHWEMRGNAFLHGELAPIDWATVTASIRLDYNTETGVFLSPKLAAVCTPASGQFARLGVTRAFHKPTFLESGIHFNVTFPDESPITGPDRGQFREFMTRVLGYDGLENEELISFEIGYLGQFLNETFSVALDLYLNRYSNRNDIDPKILVTEQGLPDLERSSFRYDNIGEGIDILGSELAVRYTPSPFLAFLASWTHKEIYRRDAGVWDGREPRNFITLGGRFRTDAGLLGSLYVFTRSGFRDTAVFNPGGLLEPVLQERVDDTMLFLGKLGWRWLGGIGVELECGVKFWLPVSPFSAPHFRTRDTGGGVTPEGTRYGAHLTRRVVTAYLQGSF
jgi:iron complex outermembrane receptor protein